MLNIEEKFIKVQVQCSDWKQVVNEALDLFEEEKIVTSEYKKAIFKSFEEYGPYMVIAPSIALLHARPEDGVLKTGLGIMVLKTPINFGSDLNDPVKLVITLSSIDNVSHTNLLSELMKLLMNKEKLHEVMNASKIDTVLEVINNI